MNETEKGVWPEGATDFHEKSYVLKSGMLRINRGLHCHTKSSVHAPQRVLDLPKCLYSINNMFILFTHVLLANANVFPWAEMDFSLSCVASVIHLFVQSICGATPIHINRSIVGGCCALTGSTWPWYSVYLSVLFLRNIEFKPWTWLYSFF